jgi:hypothetical protein
MALSAMMTKKRKMKKKLTCRDCNKEFAEKLPGAPGFRNQCSTCSLTQPEPEPIGGNMIWDHKTAPYIELKPMKEAKRFAAQTKRLGAGVTSCLLESKGEPKESAKTGSGSETGSEYRSNLGESRSVKTRAQG